MQSACVFDGAGVLRQYRRRATKPTDIAGVSHFLEHMTFKGTPHRSADDVNRELDELGSHSNAYTSEEQTVYYATVLPEYQQPTLNLLADIMRPSLRQEDFDTEKQVILEEILKYEDQPPFGAHEKCMAAYFQQHPLGNSILGTSRERRPIDAHRRCVTTSTAVQPRQHQTGGRRQRRLRSAGAGCDTMVWRLGSRGPRVATRLRPHRTKSSA